MIDTKYIVSRKLTEQDRGRGERIKIIINFFSTHEHKRLPYLLLKSHHTYTHFTQKMDETNRQCDIFNKYFEPMLRWSMDPAANLTDNIVSSYLTQTWIRYINILFFLYDASILSKRKVYRFDALFSNSIDFFG